jgi:hypothetical protein
VILMRENDVDFTLEVLRELGVYALVVIVFVAAFALVAWIGFNLGKDIERIEEQEQRDENEKGPDGTGE